MKSIVGITMCTLVLAFTVPAVALFGLPETVEGVVENINAETLSILKEEGTTQEMVELQINEETKLEESIASLDNLQEGDRVKVKYKEDGELKIALSIAKVEEEPQEAATDYTM